jgi:archaellum component FlaF (FlaF/FlaG flagellin family)
MGFGGIIATGITVIVLIVAGYLVIAGLAYSVDSANAAGTAVRDAAGDRMHTSLAVTNVTKVDAYALSFNVTNTGNTAIANVTLMDVFVLPVSLGRVTSCQYLPFADNASHDIPDHWFVVGWVGKSVGAACMLEPGGQMAIQCEFQYQVPVNPVGYVEVVAPDGVKAYQSYKY